MRVSLTSSNTQVRQARRLLELIEYYMLLQVRLAVKLADCKVQKNNHTLNGTFCMNFWAKSVEQISYNSVLLSAQVSIKSKVWSHIHEKPDHW